MDKTIINLSIDSKLFEKDSAVAERFISYGKLFKEMHVIVYTKPGYTAVNLAPNVFLYPTNTFWKPFYFISAYTLGKKIIKTGNIITSQDAMTNIVGVYLKKKTGALLQVQLHTDFMNPLFAKESLKNWIRYKLYRWAIPHADYVRAVSVRILESVRPLLKCKENRVTVLPLFIDKEKLLKNTAASDIRATYPQFAFILLMASRFEIEKNIGMALLVFKKTLKRYPQTGLVLIGKGSQAGIIKRKVAQLGLEKNVIILPWTQTMGDYYRSANAFISTSDYEGYGLTLAEAALMELPIVTTNVGIASELLENGKDALICEPRDNECFQKNLERLIEDNGLREMLKLNALEKVKAAILGKDDYMKAYQAMFNN